MGPKYFFVLTIRKMIKIFIFEIKYCFSALLKSDIMTYMVTYIEDIQVFGVNMSFISLSEVKKFYIS